jgi:predicted metal-dependent HD superfamily phosphohydrolase
MGSLYLAAPTVSQCPQNDGIQPTAASPLVTIDPLSESLKVVGKVKKEPDLPMNDAMFRMWHELLGAWDVTPSLADETFEDIRQHYAGPGRFYHTLDHIAAMLETVDRLAAFTRNSNAVKLAVWLHDVIYDSRASDNEARSAEYAEQLCEKLSIPEGRKVAFLILKTKAHDAGDDPDAQVLIDADLAILGASEPAYRTYADQIRLEYAWVPKPEYRKGRREVLERFLARPRIFQFLAHPEEPARRNIAAEISRLQDA